MFYKIINICNINHVQAIVTVININLLYSTKAMYTKKHVHK